jgi:hypothetical protein
VGVVAGHLGAVLYSRHGRRLGWQALEEKGIVQGGAHPTVGKHGMDRHEDPAPTRGAQAARSGPRRHPAPALQNPHGAELRRLDPTVHPVPPEAASEGDGGAGGRGVSDPPGRPGQGCCLDSAQDAVNEENRIARVTPLPQDLARSRHPNPPDRFLAA